MKRAGMYARVSTQKQEQEETIQTQKVEIMDRIKADNNVLSPENIYEDDGWTGTILERPGLDRMREDARAGKFDVLYVFDRGRIARKFVYQEIVLEELANLEIEFVTLHDFKAETAEDQVLQAMQGVFHEYERVKIYERFRAGKHRKVRSGRLLGYNPLYGYRYIAKTVERDGYFEINEDEAKVVRLVYHWVGEEGIALREVIRRLHELGIPPRKGKRPTWTKGPIHRMLTDTTYIGMHYYNKSESVVTKNKKTDASPYRRVKKTSRRVRPKEEWMGVEVPAIVSQELFDKVQLQLGRNLKYSRRNKRNDYLLTSLIYCPCGQRRTGEGVNGHLYYRCTDRLKRFPLSRECFNGGVNVKVVDVMTWNSVVDFIRDSERVKAQAERWFGKKMEVVDSPHERRLKEIEQEKNKLLLEEQRYSEAYGQNIMSFEAYRLMMDKVNQRRSLLDSEQIGLLEQNKVQRAGKNIPIDRVLERFNQWIEQADFTKREHFIRQVVDKVTADPENLEIAGQLPVSGSYVELRHEDRHCRLAERW